MDNLTHTLFAVTLGRTPLGRAGRGTTTALVLASNAPDIDIVTTVRGSAAYLQWHRGPTHGPLGILALGLVTAAIVWAIQRYIDRKGDPPGAAPSASFGMLFVVSMVGVLCHILMDFPTSYGTRLLSPFSWHWFAVDLMPIVDVYLIAALFAGLLFGQASAASRRRNAAIVLALMAANYGVRAVARHEAIVLAPRVFGPLMPRPCDPEPRRSAHRRVADVQPTRCRCRRRASERQPLPRRARGHADVSLAVQVAAHRPPVERVRDARPRRPRSPPAPAG